MQLLALALHLMLAEMPEERLQFADSIKKIVEAECEVSCLAKLFKSKFLMHIDNVASNPNSHSRTQLYAFADFWNTHFKTAAGTALMA